MALSQLPSCIADVSGLPCIAAGADIAVIVGHAVAGGTAGAAAAGRGAHPPHGGGLAVVTVVGGGRRVAAQHADITVVAAALALHPRGTALGQTQQAHLKSSRNTLYTGLNKR